MLNSKEKRKQYAHAHPISGAIAQKLPMLIRNDGLYETLSYLLEKDKTAFAYIYSYIQMLRPEKGKGLSSIEYMNLQRECYHLAEEYKISSAKSSGKADAKTDRLWDEMDRMHKRVVEEYKKNDTGKTPGNMVRYGFKGKIWNKYKETTPKEKIIKPEEIDIPSLPSELLDDFSQYTIEAKIRDRIVVGLGECSVNEISIKMDSVYAIPYIPASSIKGVFYHYCKKQVELEIIKESCLTEWFGTEEEKGKVIFTDSYFTRYNIEKDCMTPHYGKYYNQEKWPEDTETPNIISFFCIRDAELEFVLYYDNGCTSIDDLKKKFEDCLNNCSFGAKKSSGYGYLEVKKWKKRRKQ